MFLIGDRIIIKESGDMDKMGLTGKIGTITDYGNNKGSYRVIMDDHKPSHLLLTEN